MLRSLAFLLFALCTSLQLSAVPSGYRPVVASGEQVAQVGNGFSFQISATASPSPTNYWASGLPSGLTVNATTGLISGTPTAAGSFNATIAASNAFGTGSASLKLTVAKGAQTITFSALPSTLTFGVAPVTLSASSNSGLTVSYSVQSGPASISGNKLTINGAGQIEIVASQSGDANYLPASPVSQTVEIAPATATIEITAPDVAYDGNPKPASVSTVPEGLAVHILYNGATAAPTKAGTYTVTATIEDDQYAGSDTKTMIVGYQLDSWGVNGTAVATPKGPIHAPGTVVTLTPGHGASDAYVFSRWVGDVDESDAQANPLTVTMDTSKTVIANYIHNTSAPTLVTLEPLYFMDDVPVGTVIGTLSTKDADEGDSFTYSFVKGTGDYSNARFTIVGDKLVTSSTFEFSSDRALSVRVCSSDSNGHKLESAIALNILDASPAVSFETENAFATPPFVNVIFRLSDMNRDSPYPFGRVINYPTAYLKQHPELFQIAEDSRAISAIEASPYIGKIDEVPTTIRTILLIDNSASTGGALKQIREAAKLMVDQMLPVQETAIYTFSDTLKLEQDFTNDAGALYEALDGIQVGSATTNLNGAIYSVLDQWTDSFSVDGINAGYLVVVTDGLDQAGLVDIADVIEKRDDANKRVIMVGLAINSGELGPQLGTLASSGYFEAVVNTAVDNGELKHALADVQTSIVEEANSFYWLRYVSPKRGSATREVAVSLTGNSNINAGLPPYNAARFSFNSAAFADATRGIIVNPNVVVPEGISETIHIAEGDSILLEAATYYALDASVYEWIPDNQRLLTVEDMSVNGSHSFVRLVPRVPSGTLSLTVRDVRSATLATENNTGILPSVFEKTLTVIIGTGEEAGDTPLASSTDWANNLCESSWFGWYDATYFPWIWHFNHGWIWCDMGDESTGLYFFDPSLGTWEWTNMDFYPWVYAYAPIGDWVWVDPVSKPGKRIFYVHGAARWYSESALIESESVAE
ncbi:MAG TPA: MBG domain-containing protein [Opitutales bacterium]|nr:MBG domain-containing protein [Opitutales bacterium]